MIGVLGGGGGGGARSGIPRLYALVAELWGRRKLVMEGGGKTAF